MWIEADCLKGGGDILGPTAGLGPGLPKLVRTGRGRTSKHPKDQLRLMREGYTVYMYHVDLGRVYVYPRNVRRSELAGIQLPSGFDSIMVNIIDVPIEHEVKISSQEESAAIVPDDSDSD